MAYSQSRLVCVETWAVVFDFDLVAQRVGGAEQFAEAVVAVVDGVARGVGDGGDLADAVAHFDALVEIGVLQGAREARVAEGGSVYAGAELVGGLHRRDAAQVVANVFAPTVVAVAALRQRVRARQLPKPAVGVVDTVGVQALCLDPRAAAYLAAKRL